MIRVKRGNLEGLCEPFQVDELKKAGWVVVTEAAAKAPVKEPPKDPAPGSKTGTEPPPAK